MPRYYQRHRIHGKHIVRADEVIPDILRKVHNAAEDGHEVQDQIDTLAGIVQEMYNLLPVIMQDHIAGMYLYDIAPEPKE